MQISTGTTLSLDEYDRRSRKPGFDPADWVIVAGTPAQVRTLSNHVRLGVGEKERRRKRARQQRASRRRNR